MNRSRRLLPLLLLLFVGSGCSALIYEIVWLQLLQFVIGSTAVSLGLLLGTFMGGMCLGSLLLPRLVSPRFHPLGVYAAIEFGIGLCGLEILFTMPYLGRLHAAAAICLLPPTVLMGASLPAIARWIETTPQGVSWLGLFYGGNIAGAVCGTLLAGFYLLRVHDMATATLLAAALNAAVALVALWAQTGLSHAKGPTSAPQATIQSVPGSIYLTIALSGLTALAAEVVWTRLLSLTLGATVYTFSIILAVFLIGLGIGSAAGSLLARRLANPRAALGCCQALLALSVAWAAFLIARAIPYWSIAAAPGNPWPGFAFDFARCLPAILPAACLWGASFPLALAAAARPGQDPGGLVGRVYAANTLGAIAGALAFSLLLIPAVGTRNCQRLLIALSAVAALAALAPLLKPRRAVVLGGLASAALIALLAWDVPPLPWGVVAYGRQLLKMAPQNASLLYMGEGVNASIAVTELDRTRYFHVSGKVEASSSDQDLRLERMLGHIPALFHAGPRSVLVVGCGAGVTAGTFVLHPAVKRIVIVEIEPLIPTVVAHYFGRENYDVVRDPRTEIVFDDARHYVLETPEKFDVITSDPIHPWVKGAATLYTKEYFEMCKRRLNPGGIVTQWVPLYESTPDAVKSEMATFFEVFPNGTVWGNDTITAEGYDVVLLGRNDDAPIDIDQLQQRLARPDHARVAASLGDLGFRTAVSLLSTYAGYAPHLGGWLQGAEINRDRNLRLQYLAGLGLNLQTAAAIYDDLLRHRRFPAEIITASGASRAALARALRISNSSQKSLRVR